MSSNLSNLKRGRKAPLPIASSQPQRAVPFRNPDYTNDESKLLEEIAHNAALARIQQGDSSPSGALSSSPRGSSLDPTRGGLPSHNHQGSSRIANLNATPKGGAPTDNDLMASMMSRLSQLELRLQYSTKEIIEKDKKVKILEEKVKILNKARDSDNPSKVNELERKCLLLQQQVNEMEEFLEDYGMIWVGGTTDPDSDVYYDDISSSDSPTGRQSTIPDGLWQPGASVTGSTNFKVDFNAVLESIRELNALAGEDVAKIQHTVDGARLKRPDPVQLTLYANGILMFRGPFRPYTDLETQNCMLDLMDGYFPSELQKKYPDGVPFNVTDKRTVQFKDRMAEVFQGAGQVLGGDKKPSRLVPSNLEKGSNTDPDPDRYEDVDNIPGPKLTMEQFLNKIPKSVVKAGKIVNVRDGLGETLQGGGKSHVTVVETPAVEELRNRLEASEAERTPSARNLTTLRIKSEKGDHTYILKMKFNDTIGDVKRYIDKQRARGAPSYVIASAFPVQTYTDMSATLHSCGLTPNAALHLKVNK